MLEEDGKGKIGNFSSDVQEKTKNGDISLAKLEKKKREFEKEIDYYWDAHNIGDYME